MTKPIPMPNPRPHTVSMRYEKLFDTWRVTFSAGGRDICARTFADAAKVEEAVQLGGGFRCLADRQAVELGLRNGLGRIDLHLTDAQWKKLTGR